MMDTERFPDELVNKYGDMKELLGQGTFGKVWQTTEDYAVKVFESEQDFMGYLSAETEVGIMQNLKSAYLMELLDVYLFEGRFHLVMPLGINLIQYFDPDEIQQIFYEVCRGLADMHADDVLHLDMKPQNCIDLGDRVVITDFGISTFQTCSKMIPTDAFTAYYRPLEAFFRGKVGKYSDVWSIGAMLYEWIVGELAFAGRTEDEAEDSLMKVFGLPTEANWPGVTKLPGYAAFVRGRTGRNPYASIDQLTVSHSREFFDRITDPVARDLLEKILVVNPERRLTIFEVLQHPYVRGIEVEPLRFDLRNPPGCFENLQKFSPDSESFPASIFPGKGYPRRENFLPSELNASSTKVSEYFAPLPSTGLPSITPKIFITLAGWMWETCANLQLTTLTYSQAMIMLIWVIRSMGIGAHKFQLVGVGCILIASDVYGEAPVYIGDLVNEARYKFKVDEVRAIRDIILNRIGFRTVFTSPGSFVNFWLNRGSPDQRQGVSQRTVKEEALMEDISFVLHSSYAILELSIEDLGDLIFQTFVSVNERGVLPERAREFIQRDYTISDEDEAQKVRERLLDLSY